ncbi:MAG: hypothetical protein OXG24_02575 [Gammaproteobacteria bacterium]|nr:hypothetical protein [Gammaproteobacteria bacterium]
MRRQSTHIENSLQASLTIFTATMLIPACTILSESEQLSDLPVQTESAESQLDHEAEYEKAKQECADAGGQWVWYMHGDGPEFYTYSMRCWDKDDPPRKPGSPRWKEPALLPYEVYVVHSRATNRVIEFSRVDSDSKEEPKDGVKDVQNPTE